MNPKLNTSKRCLLMCPPDFFNVDYEINPWMDQSDKVDHAKAMEEWQQLKQTYERLGHSVEVLPAVKGWPDLVFTANAGLTIGPSQFLLSNFRYPERQGETKIDEKWFKELGWETFKTDQLYEGQGESFLWRDLLLAGYGFRSTEQTIDSLEPIVGKKVIPLRLVDPRFYHLDMALAPISDTLIAYNPTAFDEASQTLINQLGVDLIEITPEDANAFAANLVPIDNTIIMAKGAATLPSQLRERGFEVIELDMSEFRKSGGGVRCLTLDLS